MFESNSEFYEVQSRRFGPSGVLPHHRKRAERLNQELAGRAGRVLELGAGAGGTATATTELGHSVTAIELSPLRATFAKELAASSELPPTIIEGDFYMAEVGRSFDVVSYWNGFGVGEDQDQRRLLRRVATWLAPGGVMLVDVFNPSWWARLSPQLKVHEEYEACQETIFDSTSSRFVDRWWPTGSEQDAVSQSIRCYSPPDLVLLLEGTGMKVRSIDGEDNASLENYSYLAVLEQSDRP